MIKIYNSGLSTALPAIQLIFPVLVLVSFVSLFFRARKFFFRTLRPGGDSEKKFSSAAPAGGYPTHSLLQYKILVIGWWLSGFWVYYS